jgi:glycosyltransferase involved in cell wall biosynthesis
VAEPKKQRVVHLTSVHKATDIRIFEHECRSLAANGYDVTVIGAHEKPEFLGGVRIRPIARQKNRLYRAVGTTWKVYRAAVDEDADLYHFHDPELVPFGVLLRLRGKKVVYDSHEDLSEDLLNKEWLPRVLRPWVAALIGGFERLCAGRFSAVVTATPAIARRFPSNRTVAVQNFPEMQEFTSHESVRHQERDRRFVFLGNIGVPRGAVQIVRAFADVERQFGARLVLVGPIHPPALKDRLLTEAGQSRVEFLPWLSRAEVPPFLGNSLGGLVTLLPGPNRTESQPIKLYEYMAAGLPVVASDFPLWRQIVDEAKCGLLVDPENTREIADAMRWILQNPDEAYEMGQRGRRAVRDRYNWEAQSDNLIGLYRSLL